MTQWKKLSEFLLEKYKFTLVALMILAAALDIAVILVRPLDLNEGGNITWWKIVRNIEAGRGYRACDPAYVPNCAITDQKTAMREPLPVLIYALTGILTGNRPIAFQLTQLLFNLVISLGIFLLVEEIGNRSLGLVAVFMWALFLPTLRVEAHLNGDLLAGSLIILGVFFFTKGLKYGGISHWVYFGIIFGLATLSRSTSFVVALGLLGGYLVLWVTGLSSNRGGWRGPVVAALFLMITISPWAIRNMVVFGKPIFGTTLVGYNLYRHNAIVISDVFPHYVGSDEASREIEAFIARNPELNTPINESQVNDIFQREAVKLIQANFPEYLELVLYRFIPLWFNVGVLDQYGRAMTILDYFVVVQQMILLIMFLVSIWRGDRLARLFSAAIILLVLSYMAVDSQLRYLISAMPIVISISVLNLGRRFFYPDGVGQII